MTRALLVILALLATGCSSPLTQGDQLFGRFDDTVAAWEAQGYEDYTARYSVRRDARDEFRVVEIVVAGGEIVSCEVEGDWTNLWLDPSDVCREPETDPNRFMFSLLGSVDHDHLEVAVHDDGNFFDRVTYDDPDVLGEERLLTVLRLEAVPTRLAYWEQNAPRNYEIVYSRENLNGMGGGAGDGIFEVVVRDGEVVECAAQMNRGSASQVRCRPAVADPIGILFFWLAQLNADHTEVTYHPEWRFPMDVFYDDPDSVDEETRIRVHRFEVSAGA